MTVVVIERDATQTFLGLRFWDPVTDLPVTEGLRVRGQLLSADGLRRAGKQRRAEVNRGGIYAFFGLQRAELARPDAGLADGVNSRRVVVDVDDPLGRYLPVSFEARSPIRDQNGDVLHGPFRGVGAWLTHPLMLPPATLNDASGVYLWSAASRSTPAGQTSLHGRIVIGNDEEPPPAPFALVEVQRVTPQGLQPHAYGLTDDRGRINLPLAYPPVADPPVGASYAPLHDQVFAVRLRIFFGRNVIDQKLPGSDVPDLARLLIQPRAQIALRRVPPPGQPNAPRVLELGPEMAFDLRFDQPGILRTARQATEPPESILRIEPV